MSDISVPIEQHDPIKSFDFSSLRDDAMKAFGGGTEEASAPTPVEPIAEPLDQGTPSHVEEQPQAVEGMTQGQLANLKEDDLVTVKVDGEEVTMPWRDARGGVMRQAKFTKEMQALRARESEFETRQAELTQLAEEREALAEVLRNETLLRQVIQAKYPHLLQGQGQVPQQTAQEPAQDEIADIGQVRQIVQSEVQQAIRQMDALRKELQQELEGVTQTIEDRREAAGYATEVKATISDIFAQNPILTKTIPYAEQVLRYEVAKLQPRTIEETKQAFIDVAQGWLEQINAATAESRKQQVIDKQKLVENNIQPPGGAPPQPQPTSFKKTSPSGKTEVDWDKMREAALRIMG